MQITTRGEDKPARDRIVAELDRHATAAGHPFSSESRLFEARDGDTWLGGLNARWGADWVYLELLAVAEEARGRGVGRRLVEELVTQARAAGKAGIWVDTFTFQAPEFYPRMGFAEVGRIEGYPPGGARIFFQMRLDRD